MRVHWDLLLRELGCKITKDKGHVQPCPLHPDTKSTLRILDGHISTRFTCTSSACSFNTGDAVQLVASTRNMSPVEVRSLFSPDGDLYAMRTGATESQDEGYKTGLESQELIRDYLGRCHNALNTVAGCHVVSKWQENGWLSPTGRIPETFGALVPDDLPPELRQLGTSTYKDLHAIHVYTYDGTTTALVLRKTATPDNREVIRLHPNLLGTYPEAPDGAKLILVVNDERAATMLYTLAGSISKTPFPVVCSLNLPLPPQLSDVRNLYLLSYPQSRLALSDAFRYLCADELIEGSDRNVTLRVMNLKHRPEFTSIKRMTNSRTALDMSVPLTTWVARQLKHLYLGQDVTTVHQTLQEAPDLAGAREDLLAALRSEGADDILQAAVAEQCDSPKIRAVLANGRVVYRTPHGYRGAKHPGDAATTRLSNVTWEVVEELMDAKGAVWYRCQVTLSGGKPVNIQLQDTDFSTTGKLRQAIARELGKQHIPSRVVLYNHGGYNWDEIRDAFKKTVRTVHEVESFGADDCLNVHFPGLIISDAGTKIAPQLRLLSMPEEVSRLYRGIDYRTRSDEHLTPYLELWSGQTIEEAALALGVSHVLYCLIQDLLCKRSAVMPPTQHLCYIDPLPETWLPVCEQLAALFSGVTSLAHLPGSHGSKYTNFFRKLERLGSLPWIAELPTGTADHVFNMLKNIPVNVIGLGDDEQGLALSNLSNVTYVALDRAPETQPDYFPAKRIERLRAALPELLQATITATWDKSVDKWRSKTPAHAMYHGLANLFEQYWQSDQRAPVDMIIRARYIPYTTSILREFFQQLRERFYLGKNELLTKEFAEPQNADGAAAYITPDLVFIDRSIVRVLNRRKMAKLSPSGITKELRDQGLLVDVAPGRYGIDPERYWVFSRDLWEERVTQSTFNRDKPQLTVISA